MRSARPALARSRRREHHGGDGAVRVAQDLVGQARAAGGGRGEAVLAVQAQAALAGRTPMDLAAPELRHLIDIGRKSRPASLLFTHKEPEPPTALRLTWLRL